MLFEAIIFDFDGVIVDSETVSNAALAAVLTSLGHSITADQAMARYCGLRWSDCHRLIESDLGRTVDSRWLEGLVDRAVEERVTGIAPVAGIGAFLEGQGHRRLAIASSSDRPWLEAHLARLGLAHHFGDRIFSAASLPLGKPHPDIYLKAAAMVGVEPARCVVIEDHPVGAAAGAAAGMTVIGLLAARHIGEGHGERLAAAGARHLAASFQQASEILDRLEADSAMTSA